MVDQSLADFEGLPFTKMTASGNDFILINNFEGRIRPDIASSLAQKLCRRALSVGADGLILLERPRLSEACFAWRFFNADGSEAEMCGNGGRCAARFAVAEGICAEKLAFETLAGVIKAEVKDRLVKIQLTPPKDLCLEEEIHLSKGPLKISFVNTGVPHVVVLLSPEELENLAVKALGQEIRHHEAFKPAGANVNFVASLGPQKIAVRTYERGVEGETLACGTGATAAALISALKGLVTPPVEVVTRGGEILKIYFDLQEPEVVFLEGEARFVYRARLAAEALE